MRRLVPFLNILTKSIIFMSALFLLKFGKLLALSFNVIYDVTLNRLVVGMSDNKLTDMSLTTTATLCCGALNK
jgi:hypothetical protein